MDDKNVFYTCPYCKEEYSAPSDLAHCILSCEEKKRAEEEKRRKELLDSEKNARKKEVDDALETYKHLLRAYMRDYGVCSYASDDDVFNLFSSKFWNSIV
jgi:hypothetical protein